MDQLYTLFGSKTAAQILLFIEACGSGYAARIAATFTTPLSGIQQQLLKFETNGILVSRTVGKTRVLSLALAAKLRKILELFCPESWMAYPGRGVNVIFASVRDQDEQVRGFNNDGDDKRIVVDFLCFTSLRFQFLIC